MDLKDIPRSYTTVIVIVLAGILFLFLGMIIGNFASWISKDEVTKDAETESEVKRKKVPTDETEVPQEETTRELYEVFLVMDTDPDVINRARTMLLEEGFKIKVTSINKSGKVVYFLKIDNLYEKEDAEALGKDIELLYPEFNGYWLEKVVLDTIPQTGEKKETADTTDTSLTQKETITTALDRKGPLFELQVMANRDEMKIREKGRILNAAGYKTKITTTSVNDTIYYRLRLENLFTQDEGEATGESLKKQFVFIEGYWLEKVKKK